MDVVKKRTMNCREIAEQIKIGRTQAANVIRNKARLRAEYENFQGKDSNTLKEKTIRNKK